MRVLAELDYAEEAVAISAELRVDQSVDLESKRATLLTKILMLVVQSYLLLIVTVRLVDTDIENVPFDAINRTLELPVL